jgi:hypothetical protein
MRTYVQKRQLVYLEHLLFSHPRQLVPVAIELVALGLRNQASFSRSQDAVVINVLQMNALFHDVYLSLFLSSPREKIKDGDKPE